MERVEAGETFDVPRTALLLTGSVKSLLPLPAQFSLAVQNPHRTSSAADILWPSNISSSWDDASESLASRPSRGSAPGHSSSETDSISRQGSAPVVAVLPSPGAPQSDGMGRDLAGVANSSYSSSSAAGAEHISSSLHVVVHDSTGKGSAAGAAAVNGAAAGAGDKGDKSDVSRLVAPAELPPGEFKCIEEAMVLQVGPK